MDGAENKGDSWNQPKPDGTHCTRARAHTHVRMRASATIHTVGILLRGREELHPGERRQHKPKELSDFDS